MSYSRYWTETSLQWRFVWGNIIKKRLMSYSWFGKTPYISLSCKLVPVQYQEYEYAQAYASTLLTPVEIE